MEEKMSVGAESSQKKDSTIEDLNAVRKQIYWYFYVNFDENFLTI